VTVFLLSTSANAEVQIFHSPSSVQGGGVEVENYWWKFWKDCPKLEPSFFGGECRAACPNGWEVAQDVDPQTGVFVCKPESETTPKCAYVNPFCLEEVREFAEEFPLKSVFGERSLTELLIRIATIDPDVYTEISKDVTLKETTLPFFAEAFNFLTPIFEQTAFYLFQVALLLYLVFHLARRGALRLKGERYAYERPVADAVVKGFLIFLLFGLPVYHSTPGEGENQPAPTPVVVSLVRGVLLNVNDVATWVSEKLTTKYAKTVYEATVSDVTMLYDYYSTYAQKLSARYAELYQKLKKECIDPLKVPKTKLLFTNPYDWNSPRMFLVDDDTLKSYRFEGVDDAFSHAIYCRRLAMKLRGYANVISATTEFMKDVEKLKAFLVSEFEQIVQEVEKETKELVKQTGFVATGIQIPTLHLLVNQEIVTRLKETVYEQVAYFQQTPERLDQQFEDWKKILPAAVVVSIPPFSDLFNLIKSVLEGGINLVIKPLQFLFFALALPSLAVIGFLAAAIANVVVTLLSKPTSTIVAFVATYQIAMIVLAILPLIGIALAVLFRLIAFFVDLVVFVWSIPFAVTAIFLSQAEESIRRFVEEVVKFALLILLITIAPVFGVVVMEITKFVVYSYMGVGITKAASYAGGVGELVLLLLAALIYVAAQVLVVIYAFRITFKSPDFILEKVKLASTVAGTVAEEAYQSIASKIAPRI